MTDSRGSIFEYSLAFLTLAAYGSFSVFVRWSGLKGSEQYLVFWRVLFGISFTLAFVAMTGRFRELVPRDYRLLLVISGFIFAFQGIATTKAINMLPVSDAIFIIYLSPVLVAVMAPVFLKEKLEGTTIVALLIAVGGLAIISFTGRGGGGGAINYTGVGYAALAAVGYAVLVIMLKKMREKMPTVTIIIWQDLVMLLTLLPFVGFHLPPGIDAKGWGCLLVIGFFHSSVLALVYVYVAKKVKAQHLGVISYADPVFSTIFAFVFLGENPGWPTCVGGALIIAAGIMVVLKGGLFEAEPGL